MKRRIRQGHTMWLLSTEHGPDGRAERVYVADAFVVRVRGDRLYIRIGSSGTIIFYPEHMRQQRFYTTRRAAWRAAWAIVQETDRRRNAEYAAAWSEG